MSKKKKRHGGRITPKPSRPDTLERYRAWSFQALDVIEHFPIRRADLSTIRVYQAPGSSVPSDDLVGHLSSLAFGSSAGLYDRLVDTRARALRMTRHSIKHHGYFDLLGGIALASVDERHGVLHLSAPLSSRAEIDEALMIHVGASHVSSVLDADFEPEQETPRSHRIQTLLGIALVNDPGLGVSPDELRVLSDLSTAVAARGRVDSVGELIARARDMEHAVFR